MSVESYAHKAAKAVVVSWLRDAAAEYDARRPGLGELGWGVMCRPNRPAPGWGVWTEYPFTKEGWGQQGTGMGLIWDEFGCGGVGPLALSRYAVTPPTYDDLLAEGQIPNVIVDIAVAHKGSIGAVIEIVHKHPLTPDKIDILLSLDIYEVWAVPAAWVLGQVERPPALLPEFLVRNRNHVSIKPYRRKQTRDQFPTAEQIRTVAEQERWVKRVVAQFPLPPH